MVVLSFYCQWLSVTTSDLIFVLFIDIKTIVESTFSGVTKKYHSCQKYRHSSGCTAAVVEKKGVGISRAVVILKGQAHSRFFNNKHNININASWLQKSKLTVGSLTKKHNCIIKIQAQHRLFNKKTQHKNKHKRNIKTKRSKAKLPAGLFYFTKKCNKQTNKRTNW